MGKPFFLSEHFAAVAESKATSTDPAVIDARKRVIEECLKPLHQGAGGVPGLRDFMAARGLHPHWMPVHLTNVWWPYHEANGGWVDYLRLGYGKEELFVRELAKRSGVYQRLNASGTYDSMAFHHVTQLQVGIAEYGWWVNWYQHHDAWLEQKNWLEKMNRTSDHRREAFSLLDSLQDAGYSFVIYPEHDPSNPVEANSPEEFLQLISRYRENGDAISLSIELGFDSDGRENSWDVVPGLVRQEFDRLLPLYHFTSWHPRSNHYLNL